MYKLDLINSPPLLYENIYEVICTRTVIDQDKIPDMSNVKYTNSYTLIVFFDELEYPSSLTEYRFFSTLHNVIFSQP
jgi:hypothetical protein